MSRTLRVRLALLVVFALVLLPVPVLAQWGGRTDIRMPIQAGATLPATCVFTAGTRIEVFLKTDATAGQNLYFCTATNTWTQQLNSGGTMSSGTTNRLPKYTAATTIADSLLSDDGTTLTYTGTGGISTTGTAGTFVDTAIVAPATPASGKGAFYTDSTLKVLSHKDDAGVVTQTVKSVNLRRTCNIIVGADNGAVLVDADLGPQTGQCLFPHAATVQEIMVLADGGTPNVIVKKTSVGAANTNLLSSALATGAAGVRACSKTTAVTSIDATTTCSATLQNNTIAIGETVGLTSGTAGGVAKRLSIFVYYTVD